MRYWLKQMVLGRTPELETGFVHFEAFRRAREVLVDAFALEEKWDIVVSNYQELERELLVVATEHAVREMRDYEDMFMLKAPLTARVVNLLTAARLYLDHAPQHLDIDPRGTLRDDFDTERKNRHAASFEYRFMDAMRNHVQHRGMPVHLVSHGGSWVELENVSRRMEFTTTLMAKKSYLEEDSQFKKSVLKEMPDSVDIMACGRGYVEHLSHLHGFVRERLASTIGAARALIEGAHKAYSALPGAAIVGLKAISRGEDGKVVEELPLLLDWDNVRVALTRRNPVLVNLSRRYVASRPLK
jgi:hypothetical protein